MAEERSPFDDSGDGDWVSVCEAVEEEEEGKGCFWWRKERLNNHEDEEEQLPWRIWIREKCLGVEMKEIIR